MTDSAAKTFTTSLIRAGEKYRDRTALRAAVQGIPYVGGSIDMLLSGHAGKRQEERFAAFLDELDNRLRNIEEQPSFEETEDFLDFMLDVFDRVIRSKSRSKRKRFAEIIVNEIQGAQDWDSAVEVARLLDALSDIHVDVLREAISAPICGPPFDGLRVISLTPEEVDGDRIHKPKRLSVVLPRYSDVALRMACSELVSRGLLHDEGIGRWDLGSLQYLIPTELAHWFVRQISEVGNDFMETDA